MAFIVMGQRREDRTLSLTAPRPLGLWDYYEINSVMNIGRDHSHRERNPEYLPFAGFAGQGVSPRKFGNENSSTNISDQIPVLREITK